LCINSYSKTLSRRIIMHYLYFHNLLSASGVLAPGPHQGSNHPWTSLGDFRTHTPDLPTPGKILRVFMYTHRPKIQLHTNSVVYLNCHIADEWKIIIIVKKA